MRRSFRLTASDASPQRVLLHGRRTNLLREDEDGDDNYVTTDTQPIRKGRGATTTAPTSTRKTKSSAST